MFNIDYEKTTNYLISPYKLWKNTSSNATRHEFWLGVISLLTLTGLVLYPLYLLQSNLNDTGKFTLGILFLLFFLYTQICLWTLAARRLNDRGTKKIWLLLIIISLFLPIITVFINPSLVAASFLTKWGMQVYFLYLMCTNRV